MHFRLSSASLLAGTTEVPCHLSTPTDALKRDAEL